MNLQPFCAETEGADFLYIFFSKIWNNSIFRKNPGVIFFPDNVS